MKPGNWHKVGGRCFPFQGTTVDTLPHTHIREKDRSTCSDFGPVQPVTRQNCPVHSFAQVSALNPSVPQSTDVWATFWVLQVSATPATFQSPDQT